MANSSLSYCTKCKKMTSFYHVDPEFWECEACGHAIDNDEVGNTEDDYMDLDEEEYFDDTDEDDYIEYGDEDILEDDDDADYDDGDEEFCNHGWDD